LSVRPTLPLQSLDLRMYESRPIQSQTAINMSTINFGAYVDSLATCFDFSESILFLQMNTILLFSLSLISVSSKAPWSKYVACPSWLISSASIAHVQYPSAYRSTRAPQPRGVSAYKVHMRAVSGCAHVPGGAARTRT
jgi:hypothetical protein